MMLWETCDMIVQSFAPEYHGPRHRSAIAIQCIGSPAPPRAACAF